MLHKDLACAIGISASGLTAVIKQMNATSIQTIHIEEVSKFKIYSITPVAYKYAIQSIPELLPEVEIRVDEMKLDFSYAVEVRNIIQSKKIEEKRKENIDKIGCVRGRDKMNKKYSGGQSDFNKSIELAQKLA